VETLNQCPHCLSTNQVLAGERKLADPYLTLVDIQLNKERRFWWSCPDCQLHYASPRVTNSEAELLYQKYRCPSFRGKTALEYFEMITGLDDKESESFQKLLRLCSNLEEEAIHTVLDFGCGGGINLFHLRRLIPEAKLQGLEPNEDYRKMVARKIDIPVYETLSHVQGEVDLTLCIDVIEHLHTPEILMKSIAKLTKQFLYIEIPSPNAFLQLEIEHDVFASPHLFFFQRTHIQSLADSIQFEIKAHWESTWRQVPKDFYLLKRLS